MSVSIEPANGQSTQPAVFVLNNVSDTIASFTVNADGTLTFVDAEFSSDGPQAMALSPDGRHLAVAHGTASTTVEVFKVFRVNADATLTEILATTTPDSALDIVWASNNVLVVPRTSPGLIQTFIFNPSPPSMTFADSEAPGGFLSRVTRHPTLPLIYANDSSGADAIRWYEMAADGTLTPRGSISSAPNFPLGHQMAHNGARIYAGGGISGDGNRVIGLNAAMDGALAIIPGSPFTSPGESPAYVAFNDNDSILIVGHGTDATVRMFLINPDGSLTATGFMFDVGLQGTIGNIAVMNNVLYVTDDSTATDGITGIYAFRIEMNGALTQLGPILSTSGTRPEMIVTWKPPSAFLPADLNHDGVVNTLDLGILLSSWSIPSRAPGCGGVLPCPADINGDGVVNSLDLGILLSSWTL